MSGIKSYEGKIDDKWVLFEYDAKNDLIFYRFDSERLEANQKHSLEFTVEDERGNKSEYSNDFVW